MTPAELDRRRRVVRREALTNFLLVLLDVARTTNGRLAIAPGGPDGIFLDFRDVRTMVRRRDGGFAVAARDFRILVALPALWPFERAEAPIPVVVSPDDFAHPNSDGRMFCVDTAGITPERLVTLVYDEIRVQARRLDHPVDHAASDFVRTYFGREPADPRPLVPGDGAAEIDAPVPEPAGDTSNDGLIDIAIGVLDVALPTVTGTTVLRFARPAGEPVDRARRAYLQAAGTRIRSGKTVWQDGAALVVAGPVDPSLLRADVRELARAVDALGVETIARSYLELCAVDDHATGVPAEADRHATNQQEDS